VEHTLRESFEAEPFERISLFRLWDSLLLLERENSDRNAYRAVDRSWTKALNGRVLNGAENELSYSAAAGRLASCGVYNSLTSF
jgi:hypothetical protein